MQGKSPSPAASAASEDLWQLFLARLTASGATLNDIADCTPAVLQTVLVELGFSGLQSAKIQTEWTRRRGQPVGTSPSPASVRGGSLTGIAMSSGCTRHPVNEGSAEFIDVATVAVDFLQRGSFTPSILGVESVVNPVREKLCRDYRVSLRGDASSSLKGRLVPLDQVDRSCADGPIPHPVVDKLLPPALVFHSEADDHSIGLLLMGAATPTKLVLFDFVAGNAKDITEDDAMALSTYPGEQIKRSLMQESYDSLRIQHKHGYRPDVMAIFDGRHAFARYIVTFTYGAGGASTSFATPSRGSRSTMSPSHAFLPEGTMLRAGPGATCRKHPQKQYDFWCVDESKLVCSHCMFVDGYQKKHCILLEEAAEREGPWLDAWVRNAEGFSGDASRVMQLFDAAMDGIDEATDESLSVLAQSIAQLKNDLDHLYTRCETDVRERGKQQAVGLQKALAQVVALQSAVEDVTRAARQAIVSGNPVDILAAREAAGGRWPEVEVPEHKAPRIHFDAAVAAATLEQLVAIVDVDGTVELPLVIDVNQLASGVDTALGVDRSESA